MAKEKKLLFSLTKKDFEIQTFRCGGKGGQNVNKVETGVRIIHTASNARSESCEQRHQHQNKVIAFRKLVETPKFRAWHKAECARRLGKAGIDIDKAVDEAMREHNLKVETF
jgi:protein subunit release factor B